ncbi:MAG: serine/threonine protein kinase, partial [Gemmatimonadota bacterium]|nr:serine/threonine protein kinase [Gemmatimonadota bacterium]
MPIDAERWQLVKELFGEIAELPADERAARMMAVDDDDVRSEVAALLAAADVMSDRFERAPMLPVDALADLVTAPGMLAAGLRVGPYRIVREIGRGGMGLVFEARRDDAQFEKRVALKAMLPGLVSGEVVRRFGQERQILAHLEHHNIAALLDAGVTEFNQPYFIMEYVEGEPISQYCAARRVPVRDRLELMRQVCDAVQYAHEQLIVHRDLKPGNIFVTSDGT